MLATSQITSEPAILLAIKTLKEKEVYIRAAIMQLERNLRRIRFCSQNLTTDEIKRMQSLSLSSGQHARKLPSRKSAPLPIRPSFQQPVVG